MTQSEVSTPDCLAWDNDVPTKTPGQSELLEITHFLALHPTGS